MPGLSPITQNFISPFQQARNKALSQSDLPHIFSLGLMYDLPFGKGKHFLNRGGTLDKLAGGWQINTIFRATSGSPFVIYSSYCNIPDQFDATCLPSILPGANPFLQSPSSYNPGRGPLLNTAAFENPNSFNFYLGTGSPVSNLRGPGFRNEDLSIFKTIPFHERVSLQFRGEAFNVWNWHDFNNSFVTDVADPNFGQWNGGVGAPRNIQLAIKLLF